LWQCASHSGSQDLLHRSNTRGQAWMDATKLLGCDQQVALRSGNRSELWAGRCIMDGTTTCQQGCLIYLTAQRERDCTALDRIIGSIHASLMGQALAPHTMQQCRTNKKTGRNERTQCTCPCFTIVYDILYILVSQNYYHYSSGSLLRTSRGRRHRQFPVLHPRSRGSPVERCKSSSANAQRIRFSQQMVSSATNALQEPSHGKETHRGEPGVRTYLRQCQAPGHPGFLAPEIQPPLLLVALIPACILRGSGGGWI
jgi:hypothetical protein